MVEGEKTRFWIPEELAYKGTEPAVRHARVRRRADQDQRRSEEADLDLSLPSSSAVLRRSRQSMRARHARSESPARAADGAFIGDRADARPARLRLAHIFRRRAPAAVVVDLAADRVRGERLLQHRGEPRRRRQRRHRRRRGRPSEPASSSIRRTSVSIRLRFAVGIEIGAAEHRRPARDDARERRGEPLVERRGAIAIDAARGDLLLPPRRAARARARSPRRQHQSWRLQARRSRLKTPGLEAGSAAGSGLTHRRLASASSSATDRLARRDAFAARDVVALRVAREETIAGAAEPLPDRLRSALLHRPDRLPLRLQPLDLGGGRVPVGRVRQRLGLARRALPSSRGSRPRPPCAPRGRRGGG